MNYKTYRMTAKECLLESLKYVLGALVITYLFYDSLIAFILSFLFLPVFLAYRKRELGRARIKVLRQQFVSMIESLSSSLVSGLSVTNAFNQTLWDMEKLYGEESDIVSEIKELLSMNEVNIPIIKGLGDFAHRSGIGDIEDFSIIFSEATRSGGNLEQIIKDCATIIEEKIRLEEEIEAMLKGKVLEQRVMSIMPLLIIAYLRLTSGDFISVLYGNITGVCVMSICLLVYIAAFLLSQKIIRIKV